jgi:anti-sigma-K factor RskA
MSDRAEHCEDLLGAYVLGACPPREAELVSDHLARCGSCAREAARLRAGVDALRLDVPPIVPPPDVKGRVMAQVRADAALFDAARGRRGAVAPAPRRRWRSPAEHVWARVPAAAVAGGLVLAGLGGAAIYSALRSDPAPTKVLAADLDERRAPDGSATLEVRGERTRLRVERLPDPGPGRVYQVWMRDEREAPRPAGATFSVDADGRAEAALPAAAAAADQVLVTSEPAGGSPLPTRPPVLQVDL